MVDNAQARTAFAGVLAAAVSAGIIASSSGNATVAPMPRRIVRREIAFLVTIMMPVLLIRNGALFTSARIVDDQR